MSMPLKYADEEQELTSSIRESLRDLVHRPGGTESSARSIRRGFTPMASCVNSDNEDEDDEIAETAEETASSGDEDDSQLAVTVEFHDDNDGSVTVVRVPEGTKITEAATKAGVFIPTLCHHPRLPPAGKCGVCVVAVENGPTPTQLACTTVCRINEDGSPMKVHVHGKVLNGLANAALRRNLDLSITKQTKRFQENKAFANCGQLEIEELANWLTQENKDISSKSITFDPSLCIGCDRCVRACDNVQGMKVLESEMPTSSQPAVGVAAPPPCMTTKAGRPLSETDCISCGQCTFFCPTGAIKEVDHTPRVMQALMDPNMTVVIQTAPTVRVTLAECFGGKPGQCTTGKLVGAAKSCGFDFVFDTLLAADLTIMEEANELLKRIDIAENGTEEEKKESPLPMFTSCCPGWVNLVEQSYPELIPNLSTCRSPMAMLSSVIRKKWWPHQVSINSKLRHAQGAGAEVDQSKLFVVAVMPCTAKKDEMARQQLFLPSGRPETDAVLTVREMARLIELRGVAKKDNFQTFDEIPELPFDNPFGESTGASMIFGCTGGVMEAALRTAADVLSGKDLPDIDYHQVRGMTGIKETTVQLGADGEIGLSVAVCNQMKNVRQFLEQIETGEKSYHFIEIMTCPGGCIGGGGLPQSRDANLLQQRMKSVYSIDERMVKRKSHHNQAIVGLYRDYLEHPLSHKAHHMLHTSYTPRPRQPPVLLKMPAGAQAMAAPVDAGEAANTIYIVYGTQSGTSAQAAKDIKLELQQSIARAKLNPEPKVSLVAGNGISPDALVDRISASMASIFVTCTYGEGEMPEMIAKLWDFIESSDEGIFQGREVKYGVFGLCSSRYDVGDQYNRAARRFDKRLEALGGVRLVDVGIGDDQNSEGYRGALEPWLEILKPQLFAGGSSKTSLLDPPDPLFKISLAPAMHGPNFRPLPPDYHFVTLESFKSCVSEGYDRPAGLFRFTLEDTGLEYEVGDHLAILPRNPKPVVDSIIAIYGEALKGSQLLTVEAADPLAEVTFPKVLSVEELLTQYLNLCGRPTRSFFKMLYMFATTSPIETRRRLRSLFERDSDISLPQEEFDLYTDRNTYADVLCEFSKTCVPPFEYLLSMIPLNTPRFYSIASSPLAGETKLDLLVVMNTWTDSAKKDRAGLNTSYLFSSKPGDRFAVQIHTGILQPPVEDKDLDTPVVMFCMGAGLAPFVGFAQHRQALVKKFKEMEAAGETPPKLGPATLYFGSRYRAHDYYLEDYFQECIKEGALSAIYTAFSRDGLLPDGKKPYIYNAITNNAMGLAQALELDKPAGESNCMKARCYYCGSANGIPEAIQDSMLQALQSKDGIALSEEQAKKYMDILINIDNRFHSECF